jgi:hypothetical protein
MARRQTGTAPRWGILDGPPAVPARPATGPGSYDELAQMAGATYVELARLTDEYLTSRRRAAELLGTGRDRELASTTATSRRLAARVGELTARYQQEAR